MHESEGPGRSLGGLFDDLGAWKPPPADEKSRALAQGLVALDANVLLNLYRFGAVARGDLLGVLDRVGERLFVPHQAALEFARNRLKVALDTREELNTGASQAQKRLRELSDSLLGLMRRTGVPSEQLGAVLSGLASASEQVEKMLTEALADRTWADNPSSLSDPVLPLVEALLNGKVGPSYPAEIEAGHRKQAIERGRKLIPPGWADFENKVDPSGDFLLWRQVMDEAKRRGLPVLLVSEERKEDWLYKVKNITVGALPAMVREMREEVGVDFYLTDVSGLLHLAPRVLSAPVSEEAVREAQVERLDDDSVGENESYDVPAAGSPESMYVVLSEFAEVNDRANRGVARDEARQIARKAGMDPRGTAGYYSMDPPLLVTGEDGGRWITDTGRERLRRLSRLIAE